METQTGTVKFFNQDKGFGFIVPDDGQSDLFVHATQVDAGAVLMDGSKVEFKVGQGKKGPQAEEVRLVN